MKPAALISPDQVVAGLRVMNKQQLLYELARRAGTGLGLDPRTALEALQARERLGSTGIGRGIALPHARITGLTRFFGQCARLEKPIDFDAIDGAPVDLVFLLLGPEEDSRGHLAALAAISRPLRDPAFVLSLRKAGDGAALHRLLDQPPT